VTPEIDSNALAMDPNSRNPLTARYFTCIFPGVWAGSAIARTLCLHGRWWTLTASVASLLLVIVIAHS
jgi:hypothetical protein